MYFKTDLAMALFAFALCSLRKEENYIISPSEERACCILCDQMAQMSYFFSLPSNK